MRNTRRRALTVSTHSSRFHSAGRSCDAKEPSLSARTLTDSLTDRLRRLKHRRACDRAAAPVRGRSSSRSPSVSTQRDCQPVSRSGRRRRCRRRCRLQLRARRTRRSYSGLPSPAPARTRSHSAQQQHQRQEWTASAVVRFRVSRKEPSRGWWSVARTFRLRHPAATAASPPPPSRRPPARASAALSNLPPLRCTSTSRSPRSPVS